MALTKPTIRYKTWSETPSIEAKGFAEIGVGVGEVVGATVQSALVVSSDVNFERVFLSGQTVHPDWASP